VGVKNQIICYVSGRAWKSTYVFDLCKLPERCDVISVGQYAFDRDYGIDTHVMESDKRNYKQLLSFNCTGRICI